jgi:hypothetical protein
MRRVIHFAVRLYPAWWRAKYGPEFEALLEDMNPGFRSLFNIVNGALLMHFKRLDLPLSAAACGLLGMGLAALVFVATPARYASTSIIEIRGDDIATGPAPTAIASLAFSDSNVASLIERHGLYASARGGRPAAAARDRFREDVSVQLTSLKPRVRAEQSGNGQNTLPLRDQGTLRLSFTYPDSRKAQEVAAELGGLVIDAVLHAGEQAGTNGIRYHGQFRVAGPPQQVPAGPSLMVVMSLGMGAGVLAGIGIATVRRRMRRL